MAAHPVTNTGRVWVDYETANAKHSQLWRYSIIADPGLILSAIAEYYAFLDEILYEINILGARHAVQGSNVTLPVAWPGSASYGTGTEPLGNAPRFISWVGRSIQGARWSMQQYGLELGTPNQYRAEVSSVPQLADAWGHLLDLKDEGILVAIDGNTVQPYAYVNYNYNDHWVGEARK